MKQVITGAHVQMEAKDQDVDHRKNSVPVQILKSVKKIIMMTHELLNNFII
jgi:hypothetical protein